MAQDERVPFVKQNERRYLPVGFHFRVDFDLENVLGLGNDNDGSFQEVSGLNASIETETYQEGGENRFSHRFPKPASYQNVTFKRGMLIGSKLIKWFIDAVENFQFTPITLNVHLLNEDHKPLETWTFYNAYPVKWNIDAFNAQDGKAVIETTELCYQYFHRRVLNSDFISDAGPKDLKFK